MFNDIINTYDRSVFIDIMKIIWKKSILTLITFIICLLFMFLTYITFKPARINKLLASILHQNPINESFDDENFMN